MKNFLQKYCYSKNVSAKNSFLWMHKYDVNKEIIFHYFYERHFKIIKLISYLIISNILMNLLEMKAVINSYFNYQKHLWGLFPEAKIV